MNPDASFRRPGYTRSETRRLSRDIPEGQAQWILGALIAAFTVGFTYLAHRKYACFNWESPDTASIGYAFFHTLEGRFFPYYAREGCLLGEHADFILLAWFPIFKLAPSMVSLFFFQSLMISLVAWPAYVLARASGCDTVTSLIAGMGLTVYPPVVSQHVGQIVDDRFGLVFLLFALYFFEKKHFPKFVLFMLLATLAKETIALNVAMFGLYALIQRRRWQWVASPLVWGVAYAVAMVTWLMPKWGMWAKLVYGQMLYFKHYGSSPVEVLKYFALNPARTVETMLAPDRLMYLGLLLAPLLLVAPFRSWAWLIAVPSLLINLLGTNRLLRDLTWHYSMIAGGVLWASFLIALPRWTQTLQSRFGPRNYARILCLLGLVLSLGLCRIWLSPWQYRPTNAHQARLQAIESVPLDASVLSPENMLAHFVRHPALNSLGELRYYNRDPNQVFSYDYIVFDATYPSPDWQAQSQLFALISNRPEYRLVSARDDVFVFHRIGSPPRLLKWPARTDAAF